MSGPAAARLLEKLLAGSGVQLAEEPDGDGLYTLEVRSTVQVSADEAATVRAVRHTARRDVVHDQDPLLERAPPAEQPGVSPYAPPTPTVSGETVTFDVDAR